MKSYKIWLLGLCMSVAPLAAQSAIISILAPASDEAGSSFDAQIVITDVLDFAGFEFDLNYSTPGLTATALVSGGVFDPDTFDITNDISVPGVATLAETTFGLGLDINTNTLIGTVTLSIAANAGLGPTVLSLSNVVLTDSLGDPISNVTLQSATVNITPPASGAPIPSSLWLMSLALAAFGVSRRARKSASV